MSEKLDVLILGATGMLGNTAYRYLAGKADVRVFGTARQIRPTGLLRESFPGSLIAGVDVENHDNLVRVFSQVRPHVVINCIGLVKQIAESKNPLAAIPINTLLPHRIAALAQLSGARVVQVSTDCVFAGTTGAYSENDFPDADDLYGRTKLLGELHDPHCVTLRTSIIGHEIGSARSLVDWFLSQDVRVKGYTRAIFSGLPTVELAEVIYRFVLFRADLRGLFHVSAEPINKFDLLNLVARQYKKTIAIEPSDEVCIDRTLDSSVFRNATGYCAPSWPDLVAKMYEFR
jgi:dTDP-4-dehydrorhamnose reductase